MKITATETVTGNTVGCVWRGPCPFGLPCSVHPSGGLGGCNHGIRRPPDSVPPSDWSRLGHVLDYYMDMDQ